MEKNLGGAVSTGALHGERREKGEQEKKSFTVQGKTKSEILKDVRANRNSEYWIDILNDILEDLDYHVSIDQLTIVQANNIRKDIEELISDIYAANTLLDFSTLFEDSSKKEVDYSSDVNLIIESYAFRFSLLKQHLDVVKSIVADIEDSINVLFKK